MSVMVSVGVTEGVRVIVDVGVSVPVGVKGIEGVKMAVSDGIAASATGVCVLDVPPSWVRCSIASPSSTHPTIPASSSVLRNAMAALAWMWIRRFDASHPLLCIILTLRFFVTRASWMWKLMATAGIWRRAGWHWIIAATTISRRGWHVLRFNGKQIQEGLADYCLPRDSGDNQYAWRFDRGWDGAAQVFREGWCKRSAVEPVR